MQLLPAEAVAVGRALREGTPACDGGNCGRPLEGGGGGGRAGAANVAVLVLFVTAAC
jgi:hypothetical protein